MTEEKIRLLYVPNESGEFRQWGFRLAFTQLKRAGIIEDLSIFSLLMRRQSDGDNALRHLLERAESFAPTVVLIQHPGGMGFDTAWLAELGARTKAHVIYHEGDPYTRWRHRLPREAVVLAKVADIVYTIGTGGFAKNFKRLGAEDVRWTPHTYAPAMFGKMPPLEDRELDIIMVANANRPRTRLRALPGAAERIRTAKMLEESQFKTRIVGRNWQGLVGATPIPFWEQGNAIATAWVAANWDHYPAEPSYFSDRLPITLASGTLHVTTEHPGYDKIFGGPVPFMRTVSTPAEVLPACRELLSLSRSDRLELCYEAQKFANENLRQDSQAFGFVEEFSPSVSNAAVRDAFQAECLASAEV